MFKWNLDLNYSMPKNYTFTPDKNSGRVIMHGMPSKYDEVESKINLMAEFKEAKALLDAIKVKK